MTITKPKNSAKEMKIQNKRKKALIIIARRAAKKNLCRSRRKLSIIYNILFVHINGISSRRRLILHINNNWREHDEQAIKIVSTLTHRHTRSRSLIAGSEINMCEVHGYFILSGTTNKSTAKQIWTEERKTRQRERRRRVWSATDVKIFAMLWS